MVQDDIPPIKDGSQSQNQQFSFVKSVKGFADVFSQAATDAAKETTKAVADATKGTTKAIADTTQGATKAVVHAAQETTKVVTDVVQGTTKAVVDVAQGTTKAITDTATGIAKAATDAGQNATKEIVIYNQNKLEAGQASKEASVAAHINQINLVKITQLQKIIADLKAKYSSEKPSGVVQRLLLQQITRASTIAGAIGIIPGKIAESMGFDQTALTLLEIETVYQIAAIYEFDIQLAERRNEVFAIFDRALRASRAARMYLGFTHIIPFAGGVLNAGTDGYVLYLIADTARTFYELKAQETVPGQTLKLFVEETQKQFKRIW
jgi:uncharacterized protein (DUF697 family)